MNPKLAWPAAAVAAFALAGYIVLAVLHLDVQSYVAVLGWVAVPLLGAFVATQLQQIKEQTNGTVSKLIATVQEHSRLLAAANVPAEVIPQANPDVPPDPTSPPTGGTS